MCIWRSISIQYVQIEPGVNSDLGNGSFWVEIHDAKHVDRCSWRSTRVWLHPTDLQPQVMSTFWEMLANGRVWKQFRCLCLSQQACGASYTWCLLFASNYWAFTPSGKQNSWLCRVFLHTLNLMTSSKGQTMKVAVRMNFYNTCIFRSQHDHRSIRNHTESFRYMISV